VPRFHKGVEVSQAQRQLHELVRNVLADAAGAGAARNDLPADELANYCLHALTAACGLPATATTAGLVDAVLAGLSPSPARP
jgi:hypothetical protein